MKADLDRLMGERGLDAILVEGPDGLGTCNPDFSYFIGARFLPGLIIKKRGEPAMLVHGAWEQQQAEATGLVLIGADRWNMRDILKEKGDRFQAAVEYRRRMLTDLGVTGRVGIYGAVRAGRSLALLNELPRHVPGLEIVAEFEKDILSTARLTKDADEIEEMREVGRRTCAVVEAVVAYLRSGRDDGGVLVGRDGRPITIGDVKRLVVRELLERDLEAPDGTIFAQGRDAGLPHAGGDDAAAIRLGEAIVFDIFPRRRGGGYYHDMTRTFAVGWAPPELQEAYDQVLGAFNYVTGELKVGERTKPYQDMVCAYFERLGHPTIGSTFPITEGYIHSLGHGLGLEVHEDFGFPSLDDRGDTLQPGAVFSIEPGLYYPSRGFGVRLEDTYCCTPDGRFESLTPFPKELVIPLA